MRNESTSANARAMASTRTGIAGTRRGVRIGDLRRRRFPVGCGDQAILLSRGLRTYRRASENRVGMRLSEDVGLCLTRVGWRFEGGYFADRYLADGMPDNS